MHLRRMLKEETTIRARSGLEGEGALSEGFWGATPSSVPSRKLSLKKTTERHGNRRDLRVGRRNTTGDVGGLASKG